jgi:hypothetical protein
MLDRDDVSVAFSND